MRKVWLYQRKNRPGVYVLWYGEDGKQRSRRCPDRRTAEIYKLRLEHQLNAEFYAEAVMLPWDELRAAYIEEKRSVARVANGTIVSYEGVLNLFERHCGKPYSTKINHAILCQYVAARTKMGTAPKTVNKDLRTLHAFVCWGIEKHYMGNASEQIHWHRLRQRGAGKTHRPLSLEEFARILANAEKLYGLHWRIRLLLAIGTGLRLRDVERLKIEDIDWTRNAISTANAKAHKARSLRPLHTTILVQIRQYIGDRSAGPILADKYHHTKWDRIRVAADLPAVTYHTLRKTFGAFLAEAGFSIAVAQEMLEHSSPELTKDVYMDASREHRRAAQSIPIDAALKAAADQPPRESGPATPGRSSDNNAPSAACPSDSES